MLPIFRHGNVQPACQPPGRDAQETTSPLRSLLHRRFRLPLGYHPRLPTIQVALGTDPMRHGLLDSMRRHLPVHVNRSLLLASYFTCLLGSPQRYHFLGSL